MNNLFFSCSFIFESLINLIEDKVEEKDEDKVPNEKKSFLLNKLSKIPLISGNGIHTEGLSVKYPELEEYKGRKLILLDSAGLETPVLKSDDNIK